MKQNIKRIVLISITSLVGLIVLVGFFISTPNLNLIRNYLLNWAITLTGVALLIGVINLILVHSNKIITRKPGSAYSIVLLASLLITIFVGIYYGPTSKQVLWIFNNIQIPTETSLVALLAVILIIALIRLLYRKQTTFSLIFLFTAIIILVGSISIPWIELSLVENFQEWISRVPVLGGARGIVIGIVLGIVATGIRVLVGADRPYED